MSEEIANAAVNVPRSIFISMIINGTLGLSMLLAVLFCLGDQEAAMNAEKTYGYPFIEVFVSGVHSLAGATVMVSIVIAMAWAATIGVLATASRMVWSFARDRGLPFANILSRVSQVPTLCYNHRSEITDTEAFRSYPPMLNSRSSQSSFPQ